MTIQCEPTGATFCAQRSRSLRCLDAGFGDDRAPSRDLRLHLLAKFLRRQEMRLDALDAQVIARVGRVDGLAQQRADARDEIGRRGAGREDAEPRDDIRSRAVPSRRWSAPRAARASASALDIPSARTPPRSHLLDRARHGGDREVDVAGHDVGERRSRALVGHVVELRSRQRAEQRDREMRRAAEAAGRVGDAARLLARQADQVRARSAPETTASPPADWASCRSSRPARGPSWCRRAACRAATGRR